MIRYFILATGTFWQKLLASAKRSVTILIQFFVLLWSWAISGAGMASDVINLPQVREFMNIMLKPVYISGIIACIATLTILARMRTLPDLPTNAVNASVIPPPLPTSQEDIR
jgi:hypothetical protein